MDDGYRCAQPTLRLLPTLSGIPWAGPWSLVVTLVLLPVTCVPRLSLWLPQLMYGG
jgi:TRAP-type C4-dicarboxylate transport system permease large subunit